MRINPQVGDIWEWMGDEVFILSERKPYYKSDTYRFIGLNLTTGTFDTIVFAPSNIDTPGNTHHWRKLA